MFFESKVLKIDQSCLTENGMEYVYMTVWFTMTQKLKELLNLNKSPYILRCLT
jgi:hypothetical protein